MHERLSLWTLCRRDLAHHLDGPLYTVPVPRSLPRIVVALLTPELQLVLSFRLYSWIFRRGHPRAAYLLYLLTKHRSRCDLAMQATVGPGLRLCHAQDLVIGPLAVVGADCELFNGVTLGNRDFLDTDHRMPTLGDRVLVGTGAKVLGGIEVGDDARIGAGSVVLDSVDVGQVVAGVPARPITG